MKERPAFQFTDRESEEIDRALELRTRDRQRKLISKIDAALRRIEDGSYGYCEETGEPISLKRLDARPTATLSVEAQERHERRERNLSESQDDKPFSFSNKIGSINNKKLNQKSSEGDFMEP